jgi:predicted MFS family arabinose efflux permease
VLVIDACTYVFSFVVIATVVRVGRRIEAAARQAGLLAGVKYLFRDSLLGPITIAACAINFVAQGIILGLEAIAWFRYDQSGHILGFLFAGFGIGALAGAIVAQQVAQKVPLLKLAAVGIVAMPLPLFLLSPTTPWPAATAIVAVFGFFVPLVNAPIAGLLMVRTPVEVRAKVVTGFMTVATMAGPFGFIAAGFLLRRVSINAFFVGLPALLLLGGLAFAAVLLRHSDTEQLEAVPAG